MSVQKIILSVLKSMPSPILRLMAGKPHEIDGFSLDPNIQILANMAPAPKEQSLDEMRVSVHDTFKVLNAPRRANVHVVDNAYDGKTGRLKVREYEPDGLGANAPAILFFHQGGLVLMDIDTCDTFCTILADVCKARVISLDYNLCPEHAFPAPIEEGVALWDYVQDNASALGIDPARVAVAGDSAGGLISVNVCLKTKSRRAKIHPAAQLLAYPWVSTDMSAGGSLDSCKDAFPLNSQTMDLFNQLVFPDDKTRESLIANPLRARSLKNMPPAIIATAGFDPIRDQGDAYAARLLENDNHVVHHCFGSLSHSFLAMGNVSKAAEEASIQIAQDLAAIL